MPPEPPDDAELVAALRAGDEAAFTALVDELSPALMRVALMHVPSRAVAEEVVGDTWLGVIQGIDRFEGRSALRTWIFQILLNNARTRGKREKRTLPFASLRRRAEEGRDEPAVDADRFQGRGAPALGAPAAGVGGSRGAAREQRDARACCSTRSGSCRRASAT